MNKTLPMNKSCTSDESEMPRLLFLGSWDSPVGITIGYGLDDPGCVFGLDK